MKNSPRSTSSPDRIVIVVEGGVVQGVVCDQDHDVILVDYDNIDAGDDVGSYPTEVGSAAVRTALAQARARVRGAGKILRNMGF